MLGVTAAVVALPLLVSGYLAQVWPGAFSIGLFRQAAHSLELARVPRHARRRW